jgi:hypothetical protein
LFESPAAGQQPRRLKPTLFDTEDPTTCHEPNRNATNHGAAQAHLVGLRAG